jgi:hypothetical protein
VGAPKGWRSAPNVGKSYGRLIGRWLDLDCGDYSRSIPRGGVRARDAQLRAPVWISAFTRCGRSQTIQQEARCWPKNEPAPREGMLGVMLSHECE